MNFFFAELEIEFQRFFDGSPRADCFNFLELKSKEMKFSLIYFRSIVHIFVMTSFQDLS